MKVVLHICCGVCAAGAAERLAGEGHQVVGFFYNPNIQPRDEYERRLTAVREVAARLRFPLQTGRYDADEWLNQTVQLKQEPEGGKRCEVCFAMRLRETFLALPALGGDAFTTTLTISPRKSARTVNRIGAEIGAQKFLARDFKKMAGFHRAIELARQWRLYRQDYCGCVYSRRPPEL